jgi:hypothetical protein
MFVSRVSPAQRQQQEEPQTIAKARTTTTTTTDDRRSQSRRGRRALKRRRAIRSEAVDRLSALSTDILVHICTFLERPRAPGVSFCLSLNAPATQVLLDSANIIIIIIIIIITTGVQRPAADERAFPLLSQVVLAVSEQDAQAAHARIGQQGHAHGGQGVAGVVGGTCSSSLLWRLSLVCGII